MFSRELARACSALAPTVQGRGVTDPNTTPRRAPVTLGTFDATPSNVAAPSKANATASFALESGTCFQEYPSNQFMIARFSLPPPLTRISSTLMLRIASLIDCAVMQLAVASWSANDGDSPDI